MAGTITHSWNGTVLTVTSDSGTSSADLKGATGNTGTRGPQGPAGVVLNGDGSTGGSGGTVDLSNYYTKAQVDAKIPDITGLASQTWVENKGYLTEHQSLKTINGESIVGTGNITISGGSSIDLSNYYTKTEIDNKGYLTEHQSLKTINGQSIVGTGNITISGGSGSVTPVTVVNNESTDEQIPSAKATYDCVESYVNSNLNSLYTSIESKYTKPSGGIPKSDLASGVIPTFSLSGTTLTITTN